MKPKVSVIVCTYNDGRYIEECIKSILNQSYKDFEFILFNDSSTDNTENIIKKFNDKRIYYIKRKINSKSISVARNEAISKAKGNYIFITDGDCHVHKDWIKNGLLAFKKHNTLAIEGKLIYNYDGYKPTISDRHIENLNGRQWMTANMAYKKEVFQHTKFEKKYDGYEDRAVALQILKRSKIPFIKNMIVYHSKKERDFRLMIKENKRIISKIRLIKELNDKISEIPQIVEPKMFFLVFFPPLLLYHIFKGKVKSWEDFKLLPALYIKAAHRRYLIWKTAIKEGMFVI